MNKQTGFELIYISKQVFHPFCEIHWKLLEL